MSSESALYLDTELYKGPRWKTLRNLDLRCSAAPVSSHPMWVHNWWPLGGVRRFATRSIQHKEFIRTREQFIERLEKYNNDEIVINACKKS